MILSWAIFGNQVKGFLGERPELAGVERLAGDDAQFGHLFNHRRFSAAAEGLSFINFASSVKYSSALTVFDLFAHGRLHVNCRIHLPAGGV